jgi:hypothetical protein
LKRCREFHQHHKFVLCGKSESDAEDCARKENKAFRLQRRCIKLTF